MRGALRKEVRGHSFEELAIWPLFSPFPPLPHYLSYLTRLNNFGMVARFLYANEAPYSGFSAISSTPTFPTAQWKPGFTEISQFCQGFATDLKQTQTLNTSGHIRLFISKFFSPSI